MSQSNTAAAPRSLTGVPPATMDELNRVAENLLGLMRCIPAASDHLGLDMRQVGVFCRNTPGKKTGEALWREFTSRRDAPDAPQGYGFTNFMREVLAEAGYPLPQ